MNANFAVINPGGRDHKQFFPRGAGTPGDIGHPPVNYHAYAACMKGGFFRSESEIPDSFQAAIILLRRDLKYSLRSLKSLKKRGIRCYISWKESGAHQVAKMLDDPKHLQFFLEICSVADGFISSTQELVPLYFAAGCKEGGFIPTPYPINQPDWDFQKQQSERQGIFLGTREFDVPSRNHLAALLAACSLAERIGTYVTCISQKSSKVLHVIAKRYSNLRVQNGTLSYKDYLSLLSRHRMIFQWDESHVPGQVAGDATLCRIPCVGGNSAIEQLIFSDFSSRRLSRNETLEVVEHLLRDDAFYAKTCEECESIASQEISYESVEGSLRRLIFK